MKKDWDGDAIISPDGQYRYLLQRFWDVKLKALCMIMLNPSTADAKTDDATITRCILRAKRLGFGQLEVVNLFAFRSTDPKALRSPEILPIGASNDETIEQSARICDMVICAWGRHGTWWGRDKKVISLLKNAGVKPYALKTGKDGVPYHPLYLPMDLQPEPFAC